MASSPIVIRGRISSNKYTPIVEAFEENYQRDREKGSSVTCFARGECVVDLYGGRDESCLLLPEQLNVIFSNSKVIESLVVAMLVDRKRLKYDDKISAIWPEFGNRFPNARNVTVSDLMRHRAGCAVIENMMTRAEAAAVFADAARLEKWLLDNIKCDFDETKPRRQRYHAITRGIYVDVLVRRVDDKRRNYREFVHDEIFTYLRRELNLTSCAAFQLSVGIDEEHQSRMIVAEPQTSTLEFLLQYPLYESGYYDWKRAERRKAMGLRPHLERKARDEDDDEFFYDHLAPSEVESNRHILNPLDGSARKALMLIKDVQLGAYHYANDRVFRTLPLASATCCTNTFTVATIFNELVNGKNRLLSEEGLKKALEVDGSAYDEFMCDNITYTACGWGADRFGPGLIGWGGAGGGVTVFSLVYKCSFCYLPTRLDSRVLKPNGWRVLKAFRDVCATDEEGSS